MKAGFRIKKRYWMTILVLIILGLFGYKAAHASHKSNEGTKFVIGVSQANLTEPWRVAMNNEIKSESDRYNDLHVIYTDAAHSIDKQKQDINKLLDFGIDLLIISTNDSKSLTPIIAKVHKKIPVIVLGRAIDGYDYSLFIGPANEVIGRNAGQLVADLAGDKKVNLVEIQGLSQSPPVIERSKGFNEIIENHPNIHQVDTIVADWNRDKAEDEVIGRLKKNRKINFVFAHSDAMALGVHRALEKKGIQGVNIIGVDGLEGDDGGLDLVRRNILKGTFAYRTGGNESIQYAMDLLQGKSGIPKKILLRVNKITKENVDQFVQTKQNTLDEPKKLKNHIILGFVQVGKESSWRAANSSSIKKAAQDFDIDLKFKNANQSIDNQIEAIRNFIKERVDVIAFSPVVQTGYEEVLREAKRAGIPVILTDRELDFNDDSLWLTSIGSDFQEEGRRAARWLLGFTKGVKKDINIVELQGTQGSSPAVYRKKGFEELLKNNTNYHIIASQSADFTKEAGKRVMKEMLERYGDKIQVVYSHNDDMALGAIEAIEEAGKRPGKDILIISVDATKEAFNALFSGKLNLTVECNPLLGPELMKVILDYQEGKEIPVKIVTKEGIFSQDNAKREFINRAY
ncbi:substrate-binding domain-containing protein [Bacillus sp. AFS031507]|uniref:substrate-binding domain-containing protein n=1 Tax=Bacillus sp. AFS031507 TaxID=2033496 RepID=UPI001C5573A3|nr:substrate-binding domain-containing protein [Bacillus sp. AFS031507]